MHSPDPIGDLDLVAYVDDQLDPARRIAVEAHLSERPEAAARVMADLRSRDELRLALAGPSLAMRPATAEAARRLERSLKRGRLLSSFRRAAAVAVFVGAGWLLHQEVGPFGIGEVSASVPAPAFVADAMQAHRTGLIRASMASQPETAKADPAEIRAATAIVLPTLPDDWRPVDVQVFPSDFGPSVEMAVETKALGRLSLFAARPGTFDVVRPEATREGDLSSAYWQIGDVAYALVAPASERDALRDAAERLARTLY